MEEIIEQLREANEPVPVPLELPDEDQLVEIEEQLFIDIPFVFREFLLTVSDVVYGSLEPVTVTDPQSHTYLPDVAANAWDAGVDRSMIPILSLLVIFLLLAALSASILPTNKLLVLIAVVAAAVAALLWRWFIRVHTRMQVALLETLDNHKDSSGH